MKMKIPAGDPDRSYLTAYLIEDKANLTYIMNTWILAVQRQARRNIHAQCKAIIEGESSGKDIH